MQRRSMRIVVVTVAMITALAGAGRTSAEQIKFISACQTLSDFNTVYKLAKDIGNCGWCLNVANDKITIDLQGHSITSTCAPNVGGGAAITQDFAVPNDLITVKNGSINGYFAGVELATSTRVSVLGVKTTNNYINGVWLGAYALVKFTESSGNSYGIEVGPHSQVQQSKAHNNEIVGILAHGDNCLITMNTANSNGVGIWMDDGGVRCTVSYNTANDNLHEGILGVGGDPGDLITHNVAANNQQWQGGPSIDLGDFLLNCPATVAFNKSTNGFPASYHFLGTTNCQTVGNE